MFKGADVSQQISISGGIFVAGMSHSVWPVNAQMGRQALNEWHEKKAESNVLP